MTVGVVIRPNPAAANTVDNALWQARTAYDCGGAASGFGQPGGQHRGSSPQSRSRSQQTVRPPNARPKTA
jgi:hypothetical protein